MEHPPILKQCTKKGNSLVIKLDSPEKKLYKLENKTFIMIQILGVVEPEQAQNQSHEKGD